MRFKYKITLTIYFVPVLSANTTWRKICLLVIVLSLARTLFELLNLCTSTFVCIQNHTAVLKIIDMALGLPFSLFFLIKITFFLIFDPESALLSFYLHLSTHSRHWPSWHFRDNILFTGNSVIAWGKQIFFSVFFMRITSEWFAASLHAHSDPINVFSNDQREFVFGIYQVEPLFFSSYRVLRVSFSNLPSFYQTNEIFRNTQTVNRTKLRYLS